MQYLLVAHVGPPYPGRQTHRIELFSMIQLPPLLHLHVIFFVPSYRSAIAEHKVMTVTVMILFQVILISNAGFPTLLFFPGFLMIIIPVPTYFSSA